MRCARWLSPLVLVAAAVVTVAVPAAKATAAAAVPTRRVWVQGDSVLFGAIPNVQNGLEADGWTPTVIAWGGMQLTNSIQIFQQHLSELGSVVVIEQGSNFCCDLSQFGAQIDQAMTVLGHRHVIWLTTSLFEPRQVQINDLLREGVARWPNAELADWGGEVQANPDAVGSDGLHLTLSGRALLASFIQAHIDAWYRQFSGPARPVVQSFGSASGSASGPAGSQVTPGAVAGIAPTAGGAGYWIAETDGTVMSEGDAPSLGTLPGRLAAPVVGIAATPDRHGYWLVGSDGGVFGFGDAGFHGSLGATPLNEPIVGMASTPDGGGYWLVAADGGVFSFGDAAFHGSLGATPLNQAVVGMASTPDGGGYWLVAADGGVFALGDARFLGSTGGMRLNRPVQAMAATPDGHGYWLVGADGGVFTFGDARFFGAAGGPPGATYVALAPAPAGDGYRLLGQTPA